MDGHLDNASLSFGNESPPDLVLLSLDNLPHPAHKQVLLNHSINRFGDLLHERYPTRGIAIQMNSGSLTVALLVLYNADPMPYRPSLSNIEGALDGFVRYGISCAREIVPGSHMHNYLLYLSLKAPLDTFALVCHHQLEALAVDISRHLVSIPLHHLTDEHCTKMGAGYFRRLLFLHQGRVERLKMLLKEPHSSHPSTSDCDELDSRRLLLSSWQAAASEVCWEVKPDTHISLLRTVFTSVVNKLPCALCRTSTKEKIRKLIVDWANVKSTI